MSTFNGISPISGHVPGSMGSAVDKAAENAKIDKSAKDFESLLLSNWLQQAYSSFGSVPGGEEQDGLDAGKDQFQAIAMQSLGAAMTENGGVGIASIIAKHLHKTADASATDQAAEAASKEATKAQANAIFSTNPKLIEISGDTRR